MLIDDPVLPLNDVPAPLQPLMTALARTSAAIAFRIAKAGIGEELAGAVGINSDGDGQKALDLIADEAFLHAMHGTGLRYYASEEQPDAVEIDPAGHLALAIDPLDGSSNIDVNVSIGTIFSIFPAAEGAEPSFLRPARDQIAAGYVIYGPQTSLVVTFGQGVLHFTLDPETRSFVEAGRLVCPPTAREFAINASNARHWAPPVAEFIADCNRGATGPLGKDFNMRWVGSLVAEAHRILTRGGVFLYPGDARKGYGQGRLRMVYECAPIAYLAEQAGGAATDGAAVLMDTQAATLHGRTPLVFGSAELVARVAACHGQPG